MQRTNKVVLTGLISGLVLFGGCKSSPSDSSSVATQPSTVTDVTPLSKEEVVYLDQGWSKEVREGYYHISQGTTVMPYDIFLNLEAAGSQELFRSDANSERYGLTPDPADPKWNPDGLPIGLAKTVTTEGPWKGARHRDKLFDLP